MRSCDPVSTQLGQRQLVLITEESSDGLHYVGHNKYYDQVLINKSVTTDLMGKMVVVTVTDTDKHYIKAKPELPKSLITSQLVFNVTMAITMLLMAFLYLVMF